MEITRIVEQGAAEIGIDLPSGALETFERYYVFLEKRSKITNLTTITVEEDVANLHFLDSLAVLNVMSLKNKRVIDVGSGAGFPGVPLKLAEPTIDMTLMDATGKRVLFIQDLCKELGIFTTCLHARAEEAGHIPELRESFDAVVSRAVARLDVLCELCIPFLNIGGSLIAMKGESITSELEQALQAIYILGADITSVSDYTIPFTEIKRSIVRISKKRPTPEEYPRRYSKIKKAPLTNHAK